MNATQPLLKSVRMDYVAKVQTLLHPTLIRPLISQKTTPASRSILQWLYANRELLPPTV
jgi:hypothetical protein